MSAIEKRLLATLSMGVISGGDRFERSVAEKQVKEAVDEIVALRARVLELAGERDHLLGEVGAVAAAIYNHLHKRGNTTPAEDRENMAAAWTRIGVVLSRAALAKLDGKEK